MDLSPSNSVKKFFCDSILSRSVEIALAKGSSLPENQLESVLDFSAK